MNTITNERPADMPATQGNIIAQGNAVAQGKLQGEMQSLMHISTATYVASLTSSIMSYKHATLLEAATGIAVFSERGNKGADRHGRRTLLSIYAAAGYACTESSGGMNEYKSVQRKINITATLFEFIGAEKVREWVGGNSEGAAIAAIVKGLEPLNIRSMDGILAMCGKPRMRQAVTAPTAPVQIETKQLQPVAETVPEAAQAVKPTETMEEGEIRLEEPHTKGEQAEEPEEVTPKYTRRATDVGTKQAAANAEDFLRGAGDFVEIGTEHVSIRLSHDADKSEILKAALQLMEIADEMEAKQAQEKAETDSALAIKLMEEMRKMTTGKKAPSATEGGLEPMKPARGRRLAR